MAEIQKAKIVAFCVFAHEKFSLFSKLF